MTNFLHGCRLLWLAVTTGWLIAATTTLAGPSELRYAGRPLPLSILSAAERLCRLVVEGRPSTIASATAARPKQRTARRGLE